MKTVLFSLLLLLGVNMQAQKTVVGVVTGAAEEPVENVKVYSADNPTGVSTNMQGEYSIEVAQECTILLYSHLGKSYQEEIDGRVVLNKQLIENKPAEKESTFRFNVMLNGGGPAIYGAISGSIVIQDRASIDVGLALGKAYAGTTIYLNSPFKSSQWQPYLGANIVYFEEFMGPVSTLMYIPVGFRYLNFRGTSISFEAALLTSNNAQFFLETPLWGGIRFGKYF